mmetsp:Transcript_18545/g.57602  ORF Transcript_18545/g.57602 Transcript_18545/m.57602 type:complete len:217 (+) Transcript_18545:575-1225(+)
MRSIARDLLYRGKQRQPAHASPASSASAPPGRLSVLMSSDLEAHTRSGLVQVSVYTPAPGAGNWPSWLPAVMSGISRCAGAPLAVNSTRKMQSRSFSSRQSQPTAVPPSTSSWIACSAALPISTRSGSSPPPPLFSPVTARASSAVTMKGLFSKTSRKKARNLPISAWYSTEALSSSARSSSDGAAPPPRHATSCMAHTNTRRRVAKVVSWYSAGP